MARELKWNRCDAPSLDYQSRMFSVGLFERTYEGTNIQLVRHETLLFDYETGRHFRLSVVDGVNDEDITPHPFWEKTDGHRVRIDPA